MILLIAACTGMTPESIEYADNNYVSTDMYEEGDNITYTCIHDTSLTSDITCDASGMWSTSSLKCPSCKFSPICISKCESMISFQLALA